MWQLESTTCIPFHREWAGFRRREIWQQESDARVRHDVSSGVETQTTADSQSAARLTVEGVTT